MCGYKEYSDVLNLRSSVTPNAFIRCWQESALFKLPYGHEIQSDEFLAMNHSLPAKNLTNPNQEGRMGLLLNSRPKGGKEPAPTDCASADMAARVIFTA
ncbi:hypothetical protein Vi05172_g3397 [Venturia inaequalis]|nr:hypothetical protein Vi05172_g3397 [Venturia inaequalis]